MPSTPNTIRLEVSKARVEADLIGLIRHLVDAVVQGALLQNWGNVIGNLFRATGTIRIRRRAPCLIAAYGYRRGAQGFNEVYSVRLNRKERFVFERKPNDRIKPITVRNHDVAYRVR